MKAQQKKLSGCASNLLAHEDLGHLRRPIVGIYKPSSILKNSHLVYEIDNIGDSLEPMEGAQQQPFQAYCTLGDLLVGSVQD